MAGFSYFKALLAAGLAALCLSSSASAKTPTNWDGLAQVPAKSVDYLYLRPGADFRQYNAVLFDRTEVSFRKNWQKDVNQSRSGPRVSDAEIRKAINDAQDKLRNSFEKKFRETGFEIVSVPSPRALRVFVGVANVDVTAPEIRSAGARSYSRQAGQATLVIEVRDSLSGELLGRAVDHGVAGDHLVNIRSSASNWADFGQLFDEWAQISANGFRKLMASSPAAAR